MYRLNAFPNELIVNNLFPIPMIDRKKIVFTNYVSVKMDNTLIERSSPQALKLLQSNGRSSASVTSYGNTQFYELERLVLNLQTKMASLEYPTIPTIASEILKLNNDWRFAQNGRVLNILNVSYFLSDMQSLQTYIGSLLSKILTFRMGSNFK